MVKAMNRSMMFLLTTVVVASGFTWFAPAASVQPGRVQSAHAELANDCFACHDAFSGVRDAQCVACHRVESIGTLRVDGSSAVNARPAIQKLHASALAAAIECSVCHAEHVGRFGEGRAARFEHERIPPDLRASCSTCHADRRPTDEMHRTSSEDCSVCHTTSSWTPSTFEHDRFFRFDDKHPARCANCHETGRPLREYTCYGCHEHTPASIASEHREEGIRDFQNCVECHRSADDEGGEHRGDAREEHDRDE